MLYATVLVIVVGFALLAVQAARRRGPPQKSLGITALQAAALVALIRLSLFWAGLLLYNGHNDWRQGAGYALLILNAMVEFTLAASLSNRQLGPPLMVAGLILLTSLLLGFAWGWLRFRPPFGGAA